MSNEFIIVDTRSLITLIRGFGDSDGLDLLFSNGRSIVINANAVSEIEEGPVGINNIFQEWLNRNDNRIIRPEFTIDPMRFPNRQVNDIAMRAFVYGDENLKINGTPITDLLELEEIRDLNAERAKLGADPQFRMLSDDGGFFNGEVRSQSSKADALAARGQYAAPYEGTGHFLLEQHKQGKLSLDQIDEAFTNIRANAFDGIPQSNSRGLYQNYYLNREELKAFDPGLLARLGINIDNLLPAGVIVGAVEAARQAGIIGDILSFGITAAHADELRNDPNLSPEEAQMAANRVWVQYIFETAGGLVGAAIGVAGVSFALRGAGGFWAPILGAVAGGIGGSIGGAEAGAALYDAFPEIFDPVFDFVYDTIDELETLGNTSSEAFTLAILSSLGFDLTQTEGTDDNDWLIARGVGERNGGLGDDVILGLNAQFIAQGQQVDPDNPDSEIAQEDLRLTLDGGAGDDYVITLGGTGAITLGGEGRDFLFNTSFAGQIYGDTIDGQRNKDTITSDEFYDPDNPQENSDVFWFWPGTFIQDARPNDILQIFGLPLVGGSNSIAGIPAGDGGLAIDFFNWTTFYGTSNSGQLLVYNAIADLILNGANNSLGSIFGDGSGDILQSVQVVENYRFGGFSNEKFGRVAPGDLGLTFRIFLPRDRADEGITISLFNAAWGSVFTYIDVAFNLAKLLCFVFIPPQTSRKYCY